jgi:peroxiredoxin Q/BCP
MRTLLLAVTLTLTLAGAARAQDAAAVSSSVKVGDRAPDFSVQDHTGQTVKLADLKGKRVVLYFYPKADTPGCTKEGCAFRDLASEYEKKGVVVFGVSRDPVEANAKFAEKFHFPFRLLCDVDGKLTTAYGAVMAKRPAFARRNTYVIGPDGKVEKVLIDVNPVQSPREILDALP